MGEMLENQALRADTRLLVVAPGDLFGVHRKLVAVALLLLLAHTGAMALKYYAGNDTAFGLVPLFDFYEERNVPTYFSSLNLLLTAALLYAIARLAAQGGKHQGHAWRILAGGFLFMSIDECADLRMILSKLAKSVAGAQLEAVPLLTVAWTVPVALLLLVLAAYFIPFLLRLKPVYMVHFTLAGAAFVFAAIGFETIEGRHVALTHGVRDVAFMLMVTAEETLEIFSILYFQYFLLRYLNEYHRNVYLRLSY
ncbi:hypothetical protein [Massilia sp. Leaf139]|uniref:hypothetical protein n=1 Tax=Massilia sp. Leaf139 TaxID=1736272 RepID=UPI0006F21690|nr:hypothetical protein [Massilia sp. Leaf139]KQQ88331.1 hypothetical protein ASF77_11690 [Massilia sp. Leaf139]